MELTEKITGWFGVRVYNDRQPRENWKMKAETDNIDFSTTFDHCPEQFRDFAKEYTTNDGAKRWRVTFKIGQKCRWFDTNAQPVPKPSNEQLDGTQYECRIQYRTVLPDPNNDKSPRGYWANAIMFEEVNTNPFAAMMPQQGVAQTPQAIAEQMPPMDEGGGELPF